MDNIMASFGKQKTIRVSPHVSKLVKKTETTSFNTWCKRKGMTTKQGTATKKCIKKYIKKNNNFGQTKKLTRRQKRLQLADEFYKKGRESYLTGKKIYKHTLTSKPSVNRTTKLNIGIDKMNVGVKSLKRSVKLNPIKYIGKVTKLLISRGRWK